MRLSFLVIWLGVSFAGNAQEPLRLDYQGFTLWLDCEARGAVMFHYRAEKDSGHLPRERDFELAPDVPAQCQQRSSRSYREAPESYDRGHLVPANHLDHLPDGIRQSNFMVNILPQASRMNRGAWLRTEEIVECQRDIEPVEVWGGVLWGRNPHDDWFLESHGLRTPDYFWKLLVTSDGDNIRPMAWIVPNRAEAGAEELDRYLVPVMEIERLTGMRFDLPDDVKANQPLKSWPLPEACDKG